MSGMDEEVPMHERDRKKSNSDASNKSPFIAFTKTRFVVVVVFLLVLVIVVGVLSGVISSRYAEERARRELLEDKKKREEGGGGEGSTSLPTTEPLGPEPWYQVRLPSEIRPSHYNLYLHPNLTAEMFTGSVEISIDVSKKTEYILIHINKMIITESSVHSAKANKDKSFTIGDELEVKKTYEYKKNNYFVFIMEEDLDVGKYFVKMNYMANISVELNGLYMSRYSDKRGTRKLVTTKFEPTDARKALPCFDEPAMKATFTTTIVHQPDYTALSNMPSVSNKTLQGGLIETRFMKSVPMSTYLLAFIVCDFKYTEAMTGEYNNVTLRAWSTPDQVEQTKFALGVAQKIITYFEKYYKVSYPLPKQDLIAIPDFSSGAMENWGLITFRETTLLYQKGVSSEANKERVAVVVSHELAHQWFGNIVSPVWWNDLWLNEGFASFVEYLGVNHTHPDWEMMGQFLLTDLQNVFSLDSLATSHPISVEVDHPKKIKQMFDRISYSKGSSIIRMLSGFLGDDKFANGLQYYLKKYAFKNAATKDLWKALGESSQTDVETIMDTWTLQMGFPVVSVNRVDDTTTAKLTQKHFLLDSNAKVTTVSPYGYKWYVPFTYVTHDSPQSPKMIWMNMSSAEIQIPPLDVGWYKGNYKQIGYYRVNYDKDNWGALIGQLRRDHTVFSTEDRSSLIDDAFSLARAGYVTYDVPLGMLTYLDKERKYVPWRTALNSLGYLKNVLGNRPSFGNLQKFIRSKVASLASELGWETKPSDAHIDKYMRSSILGTACANDLPEANANATRIFKEWMAGKRPSIDVDLRSIVYKNGIANTGVKEWNSMWDKCLKTTDATEKSKLRWALGSSKKTWILNKLLASSLNASLVRTQDVVSVIRSVAYNPIGKWLAWNFVRANWDFLLNEFGTSTFRMTSLVSGVTHAMNTEFDLKEMNSFFDDTEAGTSENARKQAIERSETNIAWLKANEHTIEAWLKKTVL